MRFHSFQKVLQSTQFPFLFFHFLELAPAAAGLLLPGSTTFSTSASIPHLSSKAVSHARCVGAWTLTTAAIGVVLAGRQVSWARMPTYVKPKNAKKQRASKAGNEARYGTSGAGASPRARGVCPPPAAPPHSALLASPQSRPATFARQRARPSCSSPSMPPAQGQRALPCPPSPVRRHRRRRRHRRGWWRHRQARRFRAARLHPLHLCPWTSSRRPRALVRPNVVTARMASSGLREDACVG